MRKMFLLGILLIGTAAYGSPKRQNQMMFLLKKPVPESVVIARETVGKEISYTISYLIRHRVVSKKALPKSMFASLAKELELSLDRAPASNELQSCPSTVLIMSQLTVQDKVREFCMKQLSAPRRKALASWFRKTQKLATY